MTEAMSPWTLYWSKNTLQSCIASQHEGDAEAIEEIWRNFASGLSDDAEILDLATGNGAVPNAMLAHKSSYRITAVDQADINPLKYLTRPGNLLRVRFLGGINVGALPMDKASYDAVSSQFGIEYGDLNIISGEVARVLKPGGAFQFLMHHADSDVVRPSILLKQELDDCLKPGGLIETLKAYLSGEVAFSVLELKGQQYLKGQPKTREISGQVFKGIEVISKTAEANVEEAWKIANPMIERLKAEAMRLAQMEKASQTPVEIESFKVQNEKNGLIVKEIKPMFIGAQGSQALIGWLVSGWKPQVLLQTPDC